MNADGTLIEPPEVRRVRYQLLRADSLRMWLRSSGIGLLAVGAFAAIPISQVGFEVCAAAFGLTPVQLGALIVLAPLSVSGFLFGFFMIEARFSVHRCTWNSTHLRMGGRTYRWSAFQQFRVWPDHLGPGLDTFAIQFRKRTQAGLVLSISGLTIDVQQLAAAARFAQIAEMETSEPQAQS